MALSFSTQHPGNNLFLIHCFKRLKCRVFLLFLLLFIYFSDFPNILENKLLNKFSSPSSVTVKSSDSSKAVLLPEMFQSPGKCWMDTGTLGEETAFDNKKYRFFRFYLWVISILISCVGYSHLLALWGYETVASFNNLRVRAKLEEEGLIAGYISSAASDLLGIS